MNAKGWTLVLIVVLIAGGVGAYLLFSRNAAPLPPAETEPDAGNLEGQSIFASGEYGFTLRYPASAKETEDFSTFYHLPPAYRANGAAGATGTPVVQITGYSTESDHSYPRYFAAMVRVGVSRAAADVTACENVVPNQGETALPDAVINGATWKAFSFGDAAIMQYVKGVSYRIVHDGSCYVMEKIATGSSYQDDPDSPDDVPQETLDGAYAALDDVVMSFSFSGL